MLVMMEMYTCVETGESLSRFGRHSKQGVVAVLQKFGRR